MEVELLVTDLTFMHNGRVCFAGINHKLVNMRPVLPNHIDRTRLHLKTGDVIRPRTVLGIFLEPISDQNPPHVEDYHWDTYGPTRVLRVVDDETWCNVLDRLAQIKVADIFGASLGPRNANIPTGSGTRSLGTLKPTSVDGLRYKSHDERDRQYRLKFTDASGTKFDLPITDLTFNIYVERLKSNGLTLDYIMDLLLDRLQRGKTWLRLGLTRPHNDWHWIQVNGVYTLPDYLVGKSFVQLEA